MKHLIPIISELSEHLITKADATEKPISINISGCMGSGKSTWANELVKHLESLGKKVTHVSEDDFLQTRSYRTDLHRIMYDSGEWKGKTFWEVHENWLRLDLMRQTIMNLSKGEAIEYHPYERSTGTFSNKPKKVNPSEYIVFETSIFSELFDMVVLIHVDDEILLERKINRDQDLRNKERIEMYHRVAQFPFWQRHKPKSPDYVIDNNDMYTPKLIKS